MKKTTKLSALTFLIAILSISHSNAQIFEADGLRMPGDWNSFTNTNGMGGDFDLTKISTGTVRWQTIFEFTGTTGSQNFKFASGGSGNPWANQWAQVTGISLDTITSVGWTTNGSVGNNTVSVTNSNWYTVNWEDNGYATTDFVFMETSSEPININSTTFETTKSDSITVNIILSASKSSEEKVYVRYSSDSFSTSAHVEATGSGTNYSAVVPATSDTDFYVLTTTIDLGSNFSTYSDDYDMATIKLDNNSGSNYSYSYGFSTELTGSEGYRLLSPPAIDSFEDILAPIWTQGASSGGDVSNGDANVMEWDNGGLGQSFSGLSNLSANVTAGVGYLVYVYADDDYDGSDDAFPKTLSASGTENAVDTAPTLIGGNNSFYYLVGNPFATTIDFDNVSKTDLTDVAYVWDPNSGSGDGGTDANGSGGSWKTWNGTTGDLTDGLITPFQGFFVQANTSGFPNPEITFGSASKSSGGSFLGKVATSESSKVRFELEGQGLKNSVWLEFSEKGSYTSSVKGDASELLPLSEEYAQLGVEKSSEIFDIARFPNSGESFNVKLLVEATRNGVYNLKATDFNLLSNVKITFNDHELKRSIVVDEDFNYEVSFTRAKARRVSPLEAIENGNFAAKAAESNRFSLTITPEATSVNNEETGKVESFALAQNYPNPFNPTTTINYSVEHSGAVTLSVYNLMGQKVAELVNETKASGSYNVTWNASQAASGMYYYRLEAGGQVLTRKMTLIK